MSEPIKAGDLVMVVKPAPCCGSGQTLGQPFTVIALGMWRIRCQVCGHTTQERLLSAHDPNDETWTEVTRLKRIPPLDELEGVDEKETLHA